MLMVYEGVDGSFKGEEWISASRCEEGFLVQDLSWRIDLGHWSSTWEQLERVVD